MSTKLAVAVVRKSFTYFRGLISPKYPSTSKNLLTKVFGPQNISKTPNLSRYLDVLGYFNISSCFLSPTRHHLFLFYNKTNTAAMFRVDTSITGNINRIHSNTRRHKGRNVYRISASESHVARCIGWTYLQFELKVSLDCPPKSLNKREHVKM